MVEGHSISNAFNGKILDVQRVSVTFDGFRALNELNFSMARGELRFVIGPNGAGKTTLLDVVTGKTRPQSGSARFDERINILRSAEHQLARHGIGRKFQTPTVFGSLTLYENLVAAAGFNEGIRKLFSPVSPLDQERIQETLHLVGLFGRSDVRAATLAHGEKQWLEIAMLLVQEPKLLLLDEPVAGMTRVERNHTGHLLQSISDRCSILVVEHDMDFVRNFADQVSVLHMGALLTEGPVAQVQSEPEVIEVYLGRGREH